MNSIHCYYMATDAWDNLIEENIRNALNAFWNSKELKTEKLTDQNNFF